MLDQIVHVLPDNDDQRRSEPVRVHLLGRYMLADRREFPCQVVEMSPDLMWVAAPVSGSEGERVIVYVDRLGRLEGTIVRLLPNGFCLAISATSRKRDRVAAQLRSIAAPHQLAALGDRLEGPPPR